MRDRNWYIETWFPLHFVVSLFGKQIFVIFPVIRPLLAVFGLSVNVCAVINNVWSLLKSGGNSVPCHGIWQLQLANRLPEVWWNLSIADFLAWERIINSFVEQSLVIYRRVWILFGLFNFVFWWICINVYKFENGEIPSSNFPRVQMIATVFCAKIWKLEQNIWKIPWAMVILGELFQIIWVQMTCIENLMENHKKDQPRTFWSYTCLSLETTI